jgi:Sec-independent protein translocase protein TatA
MGDAKKGGSSFGEILGCLILIIAILAILGWFLLKPKMEEAGYSFSGIKEKASNISEKVVKTVRNTTDNVKEIKDDTVEKSSDTKEDIKDAVDELKH